MSADPAAATRSRLGEQANPHVSFNTRYLAEVIEEAEGEVCVKYVGGAEADPWWITEAAWDAWRRLDPNVK
jgi:hypothetical protein